MDKTLEKYLDTIDKHLKSLSTSERVDIVKEIKSYILEMKQDNLTTEQILEKLGDPKEMAKSYLGDWISKNNKLNWKKYLTVIAFYSLTGFSGLFIIPSLAMITPVFLVASVITPIAGVIKFLGYILNFDVPFVMFQLGTMELHPTLIFICSIFTGVIFYVLGRGSWKLLLNYINRVTKKKQDLFE